ncbi:restriction endonuclease subunit R [Clostridium frigoris]|uniref:Restriction endonuclease subunit R n=1 Tax=Clostridium frigoris TaxID=205327 RepID=A0ABS6BW55_9CLOT|nr:restriction endonuclease subunit R [Clostridium frigoris]
MKHFNSAKVVKVTGTPIRTDGEQIAGELAYSYKLSSAMANGMVKSLENFKYVPDGLLLTIDGDFSKTLTVDEILDMNLHDEDWVSRTVAYTPECSEKIVDLSLKYLNAKLEISKQPHKIIAVACSIAHAKQIKDIYERKGYRTALVHSDMKKEELEQAYSDIDNHRVSVVVNVSKLGEGYDHSYLSIAAIFRPFRHQLPYAQFIGRILRIIPDAELALDNVGQIVSHKFLALDKLWEYYKQQMEESELIKELKDIDVMPDDKEHQYNYEKSKGISYGIAKEYGEGTVIADRYMTTEILKRRKAEEIEREKKIDKLQKLLNVDREKAKSMIDTAESDDNQAKRPDKYYANKKHGFDTYIKNEIVPYLINKLVIDKESTNLKDCQLFSGKYRWIISKIKNNGGYLAVYFTQFTNDIIGKVRGDWKVEEFDRARDQLDNQVMYVKDIILAYLEI